MQGAPHPENAPEVPRLHCRQRCAEPAGDGVFQTPRTGRVESGGVLRPLEELVLVDYDLAWTVEHHDSILMSWAFYLGGGEEP